MGWTHEHAPSGWVHNQDMSGDPSQTYCVAPGCNNRLNHHTAHPTDNRSVEQEEHGANETMVEHDFQRLMKNQNLGKQFDL